MNRKEHESERENKTSITVLEDFSNELFYEIFDYLDGCDIYQSFFDLNYRFQHLFYSSNLQLKISLFPTKDFHLQKTFLKILHEQKYQLFSLRFIHTKHLDEIFSLISRNSSIIRLRSIVFMGISAEDLIEYLRILTSLPCLTSLILCLDYDQTYFSQIYHRIFHFRALKYLKISSKVYEPRISLSIVSNDQFSSIEYLIIDHSCCLDDLYSIISHTPRLIRLTCRELIRSKKIFEENRNINLDYLTFLSISECYIRFDLFEYFLKKISTMHLQVFRLETYWDANYLDAYRWEELIRQSMPILKEFSFQHHDFLDDEFEITEYHLSIDRFFSSFWIDYIKHSFELIVDIDDWTWNEIIYSIHPSKKNWWYELNEEIKTCSESIQLTLTTPVHYDCNEFFIDSTLTLFSRLLITQLHIVYNEICVEILINLISYLPNLDAIQLCSLTLDKSMKFSNEQTKTSHCLQYKSNRITKFNLQYLNDLSQLEFLLQFCSNLRYLEINDFNDIDLKSLLKIVSYQSRLSNLCLHNSILNEEIRDFIESEYLFDDCVVNYSSNKFYMHWK